MHTKTLLYLQSHQQHISSKWVKLQPFSPCFQHDQKVEMGKYWQENKVVMTTSPLWDQNLGAKNVFNIACTNESATLHIIKILNCSRHQSAIISFLRTIDFTDICCIS